MPEVRVDPLTGLKVIVADRAPVPELLVPRGDLGAAPALHPVLSADAVAPPREANADLFATQPASGAHELLDGGTAALAALQPGGLAPAMEGWRERMRAHAGAACIHLAVDEDGSRSTTQLYALDFVPAAIARERERFGAYATRTMGGNLLADLVQEEVRLRERIVAIDDEAVLLAPFASRVPFQLMLAPRRARPRFEDDGPLGSALLHDGLDRLARRLGASPPLSLWVRTAPAGADHFAWRIDVLPRLTHLAGLELGTGVNLNVLAPETAAAELRAA